MPLNSKYARRPLKTRKRGGLVKRAVRKYKKSSLVKLIKKVTLRQAETKDTHNISENLQLYHNVPYTISALLYTEQGIGDTETGLAQAAKRIGDEIVASGISLKLWFANKLDRPDILYKIIVFKYKAGSTINIGDPWENQGASNYMIRDVFTEKFKIVAVKNFRIETSAQKVINNEGNFRGAEGHRAIKMWIPIKSKIKYENGTSTPYGWDYAFSVVCYDSWGTLVTDNIASFAVNRKLYFKDP